MCDICDASFSVGEVIATCGGHPLHRCVWVNCPAPFWGWLFMVPVSEPMRESGSKRGRRGGSASGSDDCSGEDQEGHDETDSDADGFSRDEDRRVSERWYFKPDFGSEYWTIKGMVFNLAVRYGAFLAKSALGARPSAGVAHVVPDSKHYLEALFMVAPKVSDEGVVSATLEPVGTEERVRHTGLVVAPDFLLNLQRTLALPPLPPFPAPPEAAFLGHRIEVNGLKGMVVAHRVSRATGARALVILEDRGSGESATVRHAWFRHDEPLPPAPPALIPAEDLRTAMVVMTAVRARTATEQLGAAAAALGEPQDFAFLPKQ